MQWRVFGDFNRMNVFPILLLYFVAIEKTWELLWIYFVDEKKEENKQKKMFNPHLCFHMSVELGAKKKEESIDQPLT